MRNWDDSHSSCSIEYALEVYIPCIEESCLQHGAIGLHIVMHISIDSTVTMSWGSMSFPRIHPLWDKEIVKPVQPQLYGNCKTWNTVKVNFATLETHVLPMCQCHQTDIRTSSQPLLSARSTIWRRRNGNNDATHNKWFDHAMYTRNKFHRPINRVRHGWNRVEVFSLTHALHTDGAETGHQNGTHSHPQQCLGISCNISTVSGGGCALEIHSHGNRLSTLAEDTLPLNMDSNHPNIVSASDSR